MIKEKNINFYLLLFFKIFLFHNSIIFGLEMKCEKIEQNKESGELVITVLYETSEYILANTMHCTINSNMKFVVPQKANIIFVERLGEIYLPHEKESLSVLHGSGTIQLVLPLFKDQIDNFLVEYSSFNSLKNLIEPGKSIFIKINPINEKVDEATFLENNQVNAIKLDNLIIENEGKQLENIKNSSSVKKEPIKKEVTVFERITDFASEFNFFWVAIITFLLGFLMSFTPCIYPMIPITIGILGIEEEPLSRRMLLAGLYVLGIAITFSLFGVLAASGKLFFGSLFTKPWFIILVSVFMTFMTLQMLGIIESTVFFKENFRMPARLQNSILLPFFYGVFSGTITSPCVSPGLFAVLTMVSNQGNLLIGWLWLFTFGIGLGLPLWIIAVLVNKVTLFPKSGMWMVDLKEIIGIILLFVLYSYLKVLSLFWSLFIIFFILFFFLSKKYFDQNINNKYWFCSWSVLVAFCALSFFSYTAYHIYIVESNKYKIDWVASLEEAKKISMKNNKLILVDFTADWCSYCKVVDKKVFNDKNKIKLLDSFVIFCKIDCTKNSLESDLLLEKYSVSGLPTILILDTNLEELKRYSSDIVAIDAAGLESELSPLLIRS